MSSAPDTPENVPGTRAGIVAALAAVPGSGTTSTVVSLAWVLAAAGRRVLVVDGSSVRPAVEEYLRPLYLQDVVLPGVLGSVLSGRPVATRHAWPDTDGHIDVHRRDIESFGAEERAALLRSGYDDVLIDTPPSLSSATLRAAAALCDVAMVCFLSRSGAVRDAAALTTRLVREAPVTTKVVPVVTKFDDPYLPRAEHSRVMVGNAFTGLVADPDSMVEIPYRSYGVFEPIVVLAEEQAPDNPTRAEYARLAGMVTNGAVTALAPVSPSFRDRYRRAIGFRSSEQDRIIVCYASHDRPWADWVADQVSVLGVTTRRLEEGMSWQAADTPADLVVVSSAHLASSPRHRALVEFLDQANEAGAPVDLLRVVLDGTDVLPHAAGGTVTATSGTSEELAAKIANFFSLVRPVDAPPDTTRHLPGEVPTVFSLPTRNMDFVGRDDELEGLRDQLVDGTENPVTISGLPGVGKSELALEYGYRFSHVYDFVWWVPSENHQSVVDGLGELAGALSGRDPDRAVSADELSELIARGAYRRFLLIFDNVVDRADVLPLPPGGHVIITANEPAEGGIVLAPMAEHDSVAMLTSLVRGLDGDDAATVATAVHHLPVALALAGALLAEKAKTVRATGATVFDAAAWAARDLLDTLGDEPERGAEEPVERPGLPAAVPRILAVVIETMAATRNGRLTVVLAQLCTYLSSEGVGLDLVRSRAMRDRLVALGGPDAAALRLDAAEMDRLLWFGVRHGLFRVYWGAIRILRMHRVLQSALRAAMSDPARTARQADVLSVLTAYAPAEVDDQQPDYERRFTELRRHTEPSGAVESDRDDVRRWLVNQVRYLYAHGTPSTHRAALASTQKLLDAWTTRHGRNDPLRLRLAGQLANLHRTLGNPGQALRLDESVLAEQRRTLPRNDPQALVSARGLSGDLRGLGLFGEALEEDQATWVAFREELGDDHPQTRMAANNLAVSMFLSGDTAGALRVAEDNYQRRFRLLGPDHHSTWASLVQVGMLRRELGQYEASQTALLYASQQVRSQRPDPRELGVQYQWAITLRAQGNVARARDRLGPVLRDFRALLGADHPRTLACGLSLAASCRLLRTDVSLAVELARGALEGFVRNNASARAHPFVALCQLGLGLALAGADTSGVAETREAWESLRDRLGEAHPWTLAAAINHSTMLARFDDGGQAHALATDTYHDCAELLGPQHPYTRAAAHNAETGDQPAAVWEEVDVDIPDT